MPEMFHEIIYESKEKIPNPEVIHERPLKLP